LEIAPEQEAQIVRKAQMGDHAALSQLVSLYTNRIYRLALRLTGSEQDAEDVLQETFLIMIKKIKQFQMKSSFYTWLYRIAVNVGLRHLKTKPFKYQHVSIDDPDIERVSSMEAQEWPAIDDDHISRKKFRKKLDSAIEQLPEMYRTVFILRDLHELSTEDTAKILNITPSNAKIRLMRARNFLKDHLEDLVKAEAII
jgi:RNA polymerase sigma-70 factor (ECF subfamily)